MSSGSGLLRTEVPGIGYHRRLISCQNACPVHTDARGDVRAIAEGRFEEAYLIARGPNPFSSICGRICGAPCEAACRRGTIPLLDDDGRCIANDRPISIRVLKRFACERCGVDARPPEEVWESARSYVPEVCADAEELAALLRASTRGGFEPVDGKKVAILGAGPAGLSAAHDLALMGFRPVVFESEPVATGMLHLGVPEYRLPRDLIRREVAVIEALGVEIRCGITVGEDVSFADLRRDFAAVIIGVGAKRSRGLDLPGGRGPGVYGGVDLLRSVALGEPIDLGEEVLMIGGGNVAYDVARTVLRQAAYDTARTAARMPGTRLVRLASLETLEEILADIAGFYDAFAFRPCVEDPLDHIAVEVGFIGYLCLKEARALAHGEEESAETTASARRRFIADHLGRFAEEWADRVSAAGVPHLSAAAQAIAASRIGQLDRVAQEASTKGKGDSK